MASTGRQAERSEAAVTQVLDAALKLFSRQGYGATAMRQIADASGMSVGNLYHHFGGKEEIFQQLLDAYWDRLLDPDLPLNRVFREGSFPDDLERLAAAIEEVVAANTDSIRLIYVDVIEFGGSHIRRFYETMADRFAAAYGPSLERKRAAGELGEVDPLVGVMVATRWFFYYFGVELCFGVPMHLGMDSHQAVDEFIRILRYGVLPRKVTSGPKGPGNGARRGSGRNR